jgi:hypothetical protein
VSWRFKIHANSFQNTNALTILPHSHAIHIDMHYTFFILQNMHYTFIYPLRVVQTMPSKYAFVMFTK